MKKLYLFLLLLFPIPYLNASTIQPGDPSPAALTKFVSLTMKDIRHLAGRKLKLKEKIAIRFIQWKIKKEIKRSEKGESSKGKTALLFAILAIPVIGIPIVGLLFSAGFITLALVLGYSARKEDPTDRKARAAITLGWISLAVLVVLTSIIIAILTSFSVGFG